MKQTQLLTKITELGYHGFKEAYERQMEDVNYHSLPFEERLYQLLDAQTLFLKNKRIAMNRRLSKIKDKQAAVELLDFRSQRWMDKAQVHSLSSMNFIRAHQNIIITGKTGTGKSYLAQALANRAIIDGFKAYYVRTPTLLEEIRIARIDGTYTRKGVR